MKKLLLFLIIFSCAAGYGFSQQNEWYYGKIVKDITFTGLVNVSVKELNAITDAYKGSIFTDGYFLDLQDKLYSLNFFQSLIPSVDRAGKQDSDGMILRFEVTENPIVTKVSFEGSSFFSKDRLLMLIESAGYKENSIYSNNSGNLAANKIENAYINCGFRDTKIEIIVNPAKNNTCTVTYRIHEGYQYVIETVRFEGNKAISGEELKQCLIRQSRGVFNTGLARDSDFAEDTAAILRYYEDRGYEMSMNTKPEIRETRIKDAVHFLSITFRIIRESEQHFFGGFEFSGNKVFSNAQLSALVQSRAGDAYNKNIVENDIYRIVDLYGDSGYMDVDVNYNGTWKGNTIYFILTITEGDKIYFEYIIVRGNKKISVEAIREKIPLMYGDVLSRKKVMEGIRNLNNMEAFSNVDVKNDQGSKKGWKTLIITVTEK
jgi:outer membrane protein insertion porin family